MSQELDVAHPEMQRTRIGTSGYGGNGDRDFTSNDVAGIFKTKTLKKPNGPPWIPPSCGPYLAQRHNQRTVLLVNLGHAC